MPFSSTKICAEFVDAGMFVIKIGLSFLIMVLIPLSKKIVVSDLDSS
jgi:hypothetical protein